MATNPVPRKWTFDEYLAYEEETGIKHEYIDGEIYAMSGGTRWHGVIGAHCNRVIGNQILDTNCYMTNSEMRIQISKTKYVYPDFVIGCEDSIFTTDTETTLTNPVVVGEVISDSSLSYDIGLKSEYYRSLPSLQHYLIIYQDRMFIQLYTRQDKSWKLEDFREHDQIVELTAIAVKFAVNELYRGVPLEDKG